MKICLEVSMVAKLSHKGVLALVAVEMRGGGEYTTANLAALVNARTEMMREGLEELAQDFPDTVCKASSTKWRVLGEPGLVVQNLDSGDQRRKDFIEDLQKYWQARNPDVPFAFGGADGRAVTLFLKDHRNWERQDWRNALNNRARSVVSHSQPFFIWIQRLPEYAAGPLDAYGKPRGGKHVDAADKEQLNHIARQQALAANGSRAQG